MDCSHSWQKVTGAMCCLSLHAALLHEAAPGDRDGRPQMQAGGRAAGRLTPVLLEERWAAAITHAAGGKVAAVSWLLLPLLLLLLLA